MLGAKTTSTPSTGGAAAGLFVICVIALFMVILLTSQFEKPEPKATAANKPAIAAATERLQKVQANHTPGLFDQEIIDYAIRPCLAGIAHRTGLVDMMTEAEAVDLLILTRAEIVGEMMSATQNVVHQLPEFDQRMAIYEFTQENCTSTRFVPSG